MGHLCERDWKRIVVIHSGKQTATSKCTALAINASQDLMGLYRGAYEFLLYSLGNHRLTRCNSANVVVDSGSLHAAYQVLPGQEWTHVTVIPT